MNTILKWIFEKSFAGKLLNSNKTYIRSIILGITSAISLLTIALLWAPDLGMLTQIQVFLLKVNTFLESYNAHDIATFFI